jgi:hypothetical protein
MPYGFIRTYGKLAATIQTNKGEQYYAPLNNINDLILIQLNEPLTFIPVKFEVDISQWSGNAHCRKRYYAFNVEPSEQEIKI